MVLSGSRVTRACVYLHYMHAPVRSSVVVKSIEIGPRQAQPGGFNLCWLRTSITL